MSNIEFAISLGWLFTIMHITYRLIERTRTSIYAWCCSKEVILGDDYEGGKSDRCARAIYPRMRWKSFLTGWTHACLLLAAFITYVGGVVLWTLVWQEIVIRSLQ